jgi:serine/threonine-protein phosphatase 2A regulatory subunit B
VGHESGGESLLEASRDPSRKRLQSSARLPNRFGLSRGSGRSSRSGSFTGGEEVIAQDFSAKLLHLSWHPQANVIATAASNSLYIFYGQSHGEFYEPVWGASQCSGAATIGWPIHPLTSRCC